MSLQGVMTQPQQLQLQLLSVRAKSVLPFMAWCEHFSHDIYQTSQLLSRHHRVDWETGGC